MMRDSLPVIDGSPDAVAAAPGPDDHGDLMALVELRQELLARLAAEPALAEAESDLRRRLSTEFSPTRLELHAVDWASPAPVLDSIMRHEAVHEIADRDELRRRLQPADRRCYALFHPALPDVPVAFTEVALTPGAVSSITEMLDPGREPIAAEQATTAVFYSITSCQAGLRGISFGDVLLKGAVAALDRELPHLTEFVTLSPLPGFRRWLDGAGAAGEFAETSAESETASNQPRRGSGRAAADDESLRRAAEAYLLREQLADGRPADAVARFHLGNGARLERVQLHADPSERGMQASFGVMACYRYERQTA